MGRRFSCLVSDAYAVTPFAPGVLPRYNDNKGRTQRSPTLSGGGNLVVAVFGDSISMGLGPTAHTPSSSLVQNFNVNDGGVYDYVDPPLGLPRFGAGTLDGSLAGYLGDALRTAGASRVILAPFGLPGVSLGQWASTYLDNITVAFKRMSAVGLIPNAVLFIGGPNDPSTSQVDCTTALNTIIAAIRSQVPSPVPIMIPLCSTASSVQHAQVRAAQAAVVNNPAFIFQGPDSDTFAFQADGTHHSDAGNAAFAAAIQTLLHALGAPF
jgi:hypothetical protein